MDRSDDTTRGGGLLPDIDMYRYERQNLTYLKVSNCNYDRNRGELSTQSLQGIFDSWADILNNT